LGGTEVRTIDEKKRVDWNAIRAEYIGGATYRALASKYGVNKSSIVDRCKADGWKQDKEEAAYRSRTQAVQNTASAAAENAAIAARIQRALLLKMERAVNKMPLDATEVKMTEGNKTITFKLRDLASSYKDLTENVKPQEDSDLLKAAKELLGGIDSAID
jgi:hypothetical protein